MKIRRHILVPISRPRTRPHRLNEHVSRLLGATSAAWSPDGCLDHQVWTKRHLMCSQSATRAPAGCDRLGGRESPLISSAGLPNRCGAATCGLLGFVVLVNRRRRQQLQFPPPGEPSAVLVGHQIGADANAQAQLVGRA